MKDDSIRRRGLCLLPLAALCAGLPAHAATGLYASPARWIDDRSRPVELAALSGRWTVMTMAYGACRRICSTSLRLMKQAQALADQRGLPLNFLVVGLDPEQDKPEDWAAFRAMQGLQRDNWQFLSGSVAATRALADQLGIQFWRYGEHTMHDFRIALVGPRGEIVRAMSSFDQPVSLLLPGP